MTQELWATQNGSFSAELTRRAAFAWAARTSVNSPGIIAGGLLSSSDLQVSAPASGLTVTLGVGEALIGGTEGGTQGGYYFHNTAAASLTIAAANSSNPRIDLVCITAADSGYTEPSDAGGTTNGGVATVVTGTPTSGATLANGYGAPALPASSLLLAYVLVPQSATSIVSADIKNAATMVVFAGGGAAQSATGLTFTPNTSTTFENIASGSVTLECTGAPLIAMAGPITVLLTSAPDYNCFFGFSVDGGAPTAAGTVTQTTAYSSVGTPQIISPWCVLTPAAGSHTISLQQRMDQSDAVSFAASSGQIVVFQL